MYFSRTKNVFKGVPQTLHILYFGFVSSRKKIKDETIQEPKVHQKTNRIHEYKKKRPLTLYRISTSRTTFVTPHRVPIESRRAESTVP